MTGPNTQPDPVLAYIRRNMDLIGHLKKTEEVSLLFDVEPILVKTTILAAASYFEYLIVEAITRMAESHDDARMTTLVVTKAIKRQYHTFFDWDQVKLGPFRTLFGDEIAEKLKAYQKDPELERKATAFLEIGRQRNLLVHGNFASAAVSGDLEHWRSRYELAKEFVAFAQGLLSPYVPEPIKIFWLTRL